MTQISPLMLAYVLTAVAMVLNLMVLWGMSGLVRSKSGVANNEEDARVFNVPLATGDPPEVARVLRAHANAQAMINPFLILGLVFVSLGGSATVGMALFGVFAVARVIHSVAYLKQIQPLRTIIFAVSAFALLGLIVAILVRTVQLATAQAV